MECESVKNVRNDEKLVLLIKMYVSDLQKKKKKKGKSDEIKQERDDFSFLPTFLTLIL